jgi:hypothetical protein
MLSLRGALSEIMSIRWLNSKKKKIRDFNQVKCINDWNDKFLVKI